MFEKEAKEYVPNINWHAYSSKEIREEMMVCYQKGAEFGYNKAIANKWHKVADGDLPKGKEYGKDGIHRKIYLKDRFGSLYTGYYYPKDKNHKADCFAVEFLDWGLQGSHFCEKSQIIEWCEICF